jgi:hypothetical protein
MAFGDWLGILLLYSVFGFAAMVVLGTPLLFSIYALVGQASLHSWLGAAFVLQLLPTLSCAASGI